MRGRKRNVELGRQVGRTWNMAKSWSISFKHCVTATLLLSANEWKLDLANV
jgi:hypothetical protein